MRILLQTNDPETERQYRDTAERLNRYRLCVLKDEARALERLFRDPFDVLIVDDADRQKTWFRMRENALFSEAILLFRDTNGIGYLPPYVAYVFPKYTEPEEVLKRTDVLSKNREMGQGVDATVSRCLQQIGIPVYLKGFSLLKAAIRLLLRIDRPTQVRMINDVYTVLASAFQMNITVVEHAMHHAIDAAWMRADIHDLETVFGYTINPERAVPTNAEFLFLLTDRIQIKRGEAYYDG